MAQNTHGSAKKVMYGLLETRKSKIISISACIGKHKIPYKLTGRMIS